MRPKDTVYRRPRSAGKTISIAERIDSHFMRLRVDNKKSAASRLFIVTPISGQEFFAHGPFFRLERFRRENLQDL